MLLVSPVCAGAISKSTDYSSIKLWVGLISTFDYMMYQHTHSTIKIIQCAVRSRRQFSILKEHKLTGSCTLLNSVIVFLDNILKHGKKVDQWRTIKLWCKGRETVESLLIWVFVGWVNQKKLFNTEQVFFCPTLKHSWKYWCIFLPVVFKTASVHYPAKQFFLFSSCS